MHNDNMSQDDENFNPIFSFYFDHKKNTNLDMHKNHLIYGIELFSSSEVIQTLLAKILL